MNFFDDNVLLTSKAARELYAACRGLPIIDYHCHLNEREIAEDKRYADIGELWLAADHYKWRAMRLCGVDEKYITGGADFKDKFFKFAEIMPLLAGNPLYYFCHLELSIVFGITQPLNADSAAEIWKAANQKLKALSVRKLLELFKVEYVATTDAPDSRLKYHGKYGGTLVAPTFRPDAILAGTFTQGPKKALDFFVQKGCKISDHGLDDAPCGKAADTLEALAAEYKARGITVQLHIGPLRNINSNAYKTIGRDAGFDVFAASTDTDKLAAFLDRLHQKNALPKTVLYTLNPAALPAMCAISGAFPNVRVGAAWWFNDTLQGIKSHLSVLAEYACLGTFLGMLTDSRSFLSFARHDFFRRILADFLGGLVERGEYERGGAHDLMKKICYYNVKEFIGL